MKNIWLFFSFLTLNVVSYAQTEAITYDNRIYKPSIKTVECYNTRKEQSLPVITLGSTEQILFAFDDLGKANRDYSYTLEHCTADWKPSRISPNDYLESFTSDRFLDYRLSFNTIRQYTHYEVKLPNDMIRPKISGNYLLKVYEESNPQNILITQRIYITNNQVAVNVEVVPSSQVIDRFANQKINFTVAHSFQISNPYNDVKAVVMQNFDPLTAKFNTKPAFIRNGALLYNDLTTNDFRGGNEFRKFDFRSLRYKGANVQDIFRDTVNTVILYRDQAGKATKFANQFDENGNYYVRNQDGRDPRTEADYANVLFSVNAAPPVGNSEVYVVGRFNNYTLTPGNRLNYFADKQMYYGTIELKQGLYDYKYVWVTPDKTADSSILEGSFFETENSYQVFIYYRRPGGRWDDLVGYTNLTNLRR